MNPSLDALIREFRIAQDAAVALLAERLNIQRPTSAMEWTVTRPKHIAGRECSGVRIRPHGYGVEVRCGKLIVDFDWGANGEADGFDAWRLFNFHAFGNTRRDYSHDQIKAWLDDSLATGELLHPDHLYYDPRRRAAKK